MLGRALRLKLSGSANHALSWLALVLLKSLICRHQRHQTPTSNLTPTKEEEARKSASLHLGGGVSAMTGLEAGSCSPDWQPSGSGVNSCVPVCWR